VPLVCGMAFELQISGANKRDSCPTPQPPQSPCGACICANLLAASQLEYFPLKSRGILFAWAAGAPPSLASPTRGPVLGWKVVDFCVGEKVVVVLVVWCCCCCCCCWCQLDDNSNKAHSDVSICGHFPAGEIVCLRGQLGARIALGLQRGAHISRRLSSAPKESRN